MIALAYPTAAIFTSLSRRSIVAALTFKSGKSARGRVSNTIFSGRLLADAMRIMVLSGSDGPVCSTAADKDELTNDRHERPLANEK
ncbi:hypothetical protein JQ615_00175 [Bradyrhizobium jicamae]|uniref:Uncharacterized protein n=1 Tax=Bradyrhizobium jicamae TaxID=280332 RepID=A0ABS5FBR6_9BRAD|nr:hypothetical protein [Bradyrhizobium jicamae]MBR0793801.1 hypothetical protein [Bradyrhizobium jicamae]MBR0933425.1 hypothetical protein [Bradyrhizobium jicamae]